MENITKLIKNNIKPILFFLLLTCCLLQFVGVIPNNQSRTLRETNAAFKRSELQAERSRDSLVKIDKRKADTIAALRGALLKYTTITTNKYNNDRKTNTRRGVKIITIINNSGADSNLYFFARYIAAK